MASKKDMAALFGNVGKQIEESRAKEPETEVKSPAQIAPKEPEKKAEEKPVKKVTPKKEKKEVKQVIEKKEKSEEEKKPEVETSAEPLKKRGRPKNPNTRPRKRVTLDLDAQAIEDANRILAVLYTGKDKLSLTKLIDNSLLKFVADHNKELEAFNQFKK